MVRDAPVLLCAALMTSASGATTPQGAADFLSDPGMRGVLTHVQAWGDFGIDTAAAPPGGKGAALRIGDRTFAKGVGHHAGGEISVELQGRYAAFSSWVGVQWQGGGRGSVIFQVLVDGKTVFQSETMSDGTPACRVDVPLVGAQQLRLIARDAGDGISCDMADWAEACLVRDPRAPRFGACVFTLGAGASEKEVQSSAAAGGFSLVAGATGPQVAVMESARTFVAAVNRNEHVRMELPVRSAGETMRIAARVAVVSGAGAKVELAIGGEKIARLLTNGFPAEIVTQALPAGDHTLAVTTRGLDGETGVRWSGFACLRDAGRSDIPLDVPQPPAALPPPALPDLRPPIEQALIDWDWRMHDGIGTERESRSWSQAIKSTLDRGDRLLRHLQASDGVSAALAAQWASLRARDASLSTKRETTEAAWEALWRDAHRLRRRIALQNPLARLGPLLFVKQVPSTFSHQLTQYSGRCARPGGGIFLLEAPGESMRCRQLGALPAGSYLHPDVSWDGRRILFAFCATDPTVTDWRNCTTQFYHLYEMAADGSGLRGITSGTYDDFAPRFLPDGRILFLSTRRGGFHRCGRGPCPVYTLALAEADGSSPRVISFHETHEWDPAVLNDGRIIYTRWDYVDRHAVHYQQLWTSRPDGSDVRAFYGNNTLNPVGIWEARPIPGSSRVIATAAAHHAMTAGSIILLDVTRGIDGPDPVARLTQDALFPESEFPVGNWRAPAGVPAPPEVPTGEKRWPGHSYRSPYPLSEDFFLAAYSFEPLVGEPFANRPNMFGIYLVDRFGNKELLFRDPNIGSLWPIPLRARPRPPVLPALPVATAPREGMFLLQNVRASWPQIPDAAQPITHLRVLQVLPKTTPHANSPRVGLANASPGRQVLGTVPVESDGSAYFRAPAGVPLAFQALDGRGMAVQTMRSLTYLQPGETASCIGCHEHRATAPNGSGPVLAARRIPSTIEPGPEGSKPFSYPLLVQPVLDTHCVRCHRPGDANGGIDLTGSPSGEFTASYRALAPRVPFSEWKATPQANAEPLTRPDLFGARASPLMALLLKGHNAVDLSEEEIRRFATWMDANALFYGTFDPEGQKIQQRGGRIPGPALE